jgi:hypothetical protein
LVIGFTDRLLYVCMYKGGPKSSPCFATFNDLLLIAYYWKLQISVTLLFSQYRSLHTRSSQSAVTSHHNRSQQWLFLYNVFTLRFLATDFNTGTITVTLQISLYYSTHKVFKSQVKSSLHRLTFKSQLICTQ